MANAEDIKASLAEHKDFELANQKKDPILLYKILQSVNFSYQSKQDLILTMWNAEVDFIKLHQHQQPHQCVQEYYERFITLCDVNDILGNIYMMILDLLICLPRKMTKIQLLSLMRRTQPTWRWGRTS